MIWMVVNLMMGSGCFHFVAPQTCNQAITDMTVYTSGPFYSRNVKNILQCRVLCAYQRLCVGVTYDVSKTCHLNRKLVSPQPILPQMIYASKYKFDEDRNACSSSPAPCASFELCVPMDVSRDGYHCVKIIDEEEVGIRLRGGSMTDGRVEVFVGGSWGTVCNRMFDYYDAAVVCRSLGLWGGRPISQGSTTYGLSALSEILVAKLECSGQEDVITDCSHAISHKCVHTDDVGVTCNVVDTLVMPTTGTVKWAATNAWVYITLSGYTTGQESKFVTVTEFSFDTPANDFELGNTDYQWVRSTEAIAVFANLTLRFVQPSFTDAWFLEKIVVKNGIDGQEFTLPFNGWVQEGINELAVE